MYRYLFHCFFFISKFFILDFPPLEVVSRYRDSQLQVGEKYSGTIQCANNLKRI